MRLASMTSRKLSPLAIPITDWYSGSNVSMDRSTTAWGQQDKWTVTNIRVHLVRQRTAPPQPGDSQDRWAVTNIRVHLVRQRTAPPQPEDSKTSGP